jgi:flagellar hook-associated protein 2
MSFIDGLTSGLDTSTIISQLMQIERRPQVALTTRRTQEESARTELADLRSEINALRNLAADLRLPSGWDRVLATSSNPEAVSVSATSAAATGSYSFQVTSVASAASVYSTATFASTDDPVAATGATVFSASNFQALGFESLAGSGFAEGAISFEVVQASVAAKLEGVTIPTFPIAVDGTNDNVQLEVNGFQFTVSLSHGTYDSEAALASALAAAIEGDAGASQVATASLVDGDRIRLSTLAEGSASSITITGGSALGVLGLSTGTATGVDGIVSVNGTQTAITDTTGGTEVTLPSGGTGTIQVVIVGPLRQGTAEVSQNGFGSGSLADVVATINSSNLPYTAAAVNTGSGFRLQLTARQTGAASAFSIDPNIFGSTQFTVLSQGADAVLTVEGDNPFTITSPTNTFNEVVPGVSVTVQSVTTSPVTVSTERDVDTVTQKVSELVTKLNEILTRIAENTSNQPGAERSVLQGNREARRAADQLRNALVSPVDGNALSAVGLAGVQLTRSGTLTFNEDVFRERLLDDPEVLSELFSDRSGIGAAGVLDRLVKAAEAAGSAGGYLFTAGEASDRRIDDFGRQIDGYERRLVAREAALRRTFANLEVALGNLQQQSGYLAAQLGTLGGFTR